METPLSTAGRGRPRSRRQGGKPNAAIVGAEYVSGAPEAVYVAIIPRITQACLLSGR